MAIGLAGVIGWVGDITLLRSVRDVWPNIKPITACCGILCGISLYYFQPSRPFNANIFSIASYILGWLVFIISLIVIVQYALDPKLLKEKLLIENRLPYQNERMALYSGACFLFTSSNFIFHKRTRFFPLQQALTVLVIAIAITGLCNYLFYTPTTFYSWGHMRLGLYTALNFLLLGLGIIMARPELRFMALVCSDTLGGKLIRSLYLKVIALLLISVELRFLGTQFHYFDNELGMTFNTVLIIAVFTYVFWRTSKELAIEDVERKKAQALLTQSNEELMLQKEKLLASNRELEQFAYVASHDLQEPLKTISNYSSLIARKLKGGEDEETRTYLDFLNSATTRMRAQIQDLLEFARVEREKKMETVDCNALMREVLADLGGSIQESGATIGYSSLPVIHGTHLKQLFVNLISNAIKYRREGAPPVIEIACKTNSNKWLFSVKDNGIGIDEKYSQRIFHIFQKLHGKHDYEGSGIGLAICKKIVEMHGGKIWVESKPGEGATFFFTIPKKA
jgi:signal transduction histidine kinase